MGIANSTGVATKFSRICASASPSCRAQLCQRVTVPLVTAGVGISVGAGKGAGVAVVPTGATSAGTASAAAVGVGGTGVGVCSWQATSKTSATSKTTNLLKRDA